MRPKLLVLVTLVQVLLLLAPGAAASPTVGEASAGLYGKDPNSAYSRVADTSTQTFPSSGGAYDEVLQLAVVYGGGTYWINSTSWSYGSFVVPNSTANGVYPNLTLTPNSDLHFVQADLFKPGATPKDPNLGRPCTRVDVNNLPNCGIVTLAFTPTDSNAQHVECSSSSGFNCFAIASLTCTSPGQKDNLPTEEWGFDVAAIIYGTGNNFCGIGRDVWLGSNATRPTVLVGADESGNGNKLYGANVTNATGPTFGSSAWKFDGNTSAARTINLDPLGATTTITNAHNFTIVAWSNWQSPGNAFAKVVSQDWPAADDVWLIQRASGSTLQPQFVVDGTTSSADQFAITGSSSANYLTWNTWHLWTASVNTSDSKITISQDGNITGIATGPAYSDFFVTNTPLEIGMSAENSMSRCDCKLAGIALYNRNLTSSEISSVYAGNTYPSTGLVASWDMLPPPTAPTGTPGTPTVLPAPVVDPSGGCLDINWTSATGATGYGVFRSLDDASDPTASPMNASNYAYTGHVDGLSTHQCGFTGGATKHYRIVPTNAVGEGSGVSGDGGGVVPAANGTALHVNAANSTSLIVTWTAGAAATGYDVWQRNTSTTTPFIPVNSSGTYAYAGHTDATSFIATGLAPNQTVCFRVEGTNLAGEGDVSAGTCGATTLAPGAITLTGTMSDALHVALSWTTALGTPSGYNVTRNGDCGQTYYEGALVTVLLVTLCTQNSTFTVHAWNGYGNGPESNVVGPFRATPQPLTGETGAIYGATGRTNAAAALGISGTALDLLYGLIFVLGMGGVGYQVYHKNGTLIGATGGTVSGVVLATIFGFFPLWLIFALVVLGVAGAVLWRMRS